MRNTKNMLMEFLCVVVFLIIGFIFNLFDNKSKKQRTNEYETLLVDSNFEGELISDEEKKHCVTINKSKKQILCCIISTNGIEDSKLIDNINITAQIVNLKSPTEYSSNFMFVDDVNKNIHIIDMSYYRLTYHKIKFEDILTAELITDHITISSKSTLGTIGRGIAGAAVAGGVGAIIGGTTGSSKTIDKFSTLELKITTKDITNPSIITSWYTGSLIKASNSHAYTLASKAKDLICIIIENNKNNNEQYFSISDELLKLSTLRTKNIITEEEYQLLKTELINKK